MKAGQLINMLRGLEDFDLKECALTVEILEALGVNDSEVYKRGWEDAINKLADEMYHEAMEVDHEKDGMQRWDSGCWIRYKLFEMVADKVMRRTE